MTEKTLRAGDKARWDHSQGSTIGKVGGKAASPA